MLFKTLTVTINIWLYHYQRWHWEIRNTCWWLDTNNYIIVSLYKRLTTFIISPWTRSVYYEYHVISYFTQSNQMYSLISYKRFVKQTIVIDDFLLHDAIIPCNTDNVPWCICIGSKTPILYFPCLCCGSFLW